MKSVIASLILLAVGLTGQFSRAEISAPVSIIVMAQVKVKPGTEQAFKQAATEILAPTRNEAGNISYVFVQSIQDPTRFATTEVWTSQTALNRHMTTSHMQEFFKKVGDMFEPGYQVINEYQAFEK